MGWRGAGGRTLWIAGMVLLTFGASWARRADGGRELGGPAPAWAVQVLPLALAACLAILLLAFWRDEGALGRFEPMPRGELDQGFLRRSLLQFPPEIAGAVFHQGTGPAEVAAILARMVLEGKLRSRVEPVVPPLSPVLALELLVPRERLGGYERKLVDALFGDQDRIDTYALRERYSDGFRPARLIEAEIEQAAAPYGRRRQRFDWRWLPSWLAVGGPVLAVAATPSGGIGVGAVFACFAASTVLGAGYSSSLDRPRLWLALAVVPFALLACVLPWALARGLLALDLGQLAGLVLLAAGAFSSLLNGMRSKQTPEGTRLRRLMAAARRHLAAELRWPEPKLQNGWYPHLLALDLGPAVDRWFRRHGGQAGGSNGPAGSGAWGRGGALVDQGATQGWASAALSFAKGASERSPSGPD